MLDNEHALHNSQDIYYRNPVGAAEAGSRVHMTLRLRTQGEIKNVLLRCWQDQRGEKLVVMHEAKAPELEQEQHDFTGELVMPEKGCLIWYYFIISMTDGTWYYGNNPEQLGGRGQIYDHEPPSFQITVYNRGAKTPDWFKHAIMYQIFPDRFCRVGDKIVPKKGAVYHACWDDEPFYYKDADTKEIISYDFYGGNLKGIESKLPMLQELGIGVIYLNPIFESESNHHYDTGDYKKIDPILGTELLRGGEPGLQPIKLLPPLKGLNAHHHDIAFAVFCDIDRLSLIMCQIGDHAVIVPKRRGGFNNHRPVSFCIILL